MERTSETATTALVVLAVLGVMAALHLMQVILVPVALALMLATLLSPFTSFLRRVLPLSATGAAVVLFLLLTVVGLFWLDPRRRRHPERCADLAHGPGAVRGDDQ